MKSWSLRQSTHFFLPWPQILVFSFWITLMWPCFPSVCSLNMTDMLMTQVPCLEQSLHGFLSFRCVFNCHFFWKHFLSCSFCVRQVKLATVFHRPKHMSWLTYSGHLIIRLKIAQGRWIWWEGFVVDGVLFSMWWFIFHPVFCINHPLQQGLPACQIWPPNVFC